jgi:peptidoglycan/LPS O-acetylase OafA/YrhL
MLGVVFIGQHFSPWIKAAGNLQGMTDHLSYLLFFQNFIPLWHHGEFAESVIGPFWSLAVEEQFYLIWPIVVWSRAPKSIIKACGVGLFITFALRLLLVPHFGVRIWLLAATPTRADGLFVGSALAAVFAMKGEFSKPLLISLTTAGTLALAAVALFAPVRELWETGSLMGVIGIPGVVLLSGALLVFSFRYRESFLAKVLQTRWLRSFGRYSYGMYVVHQTIYHSVQTFLATRFALEFPLTIAQGLLYCVGSIGLTYGVARLIFNHFESRFLSLKRYFEPVILTAGAVEKRAVEVYPRRQEVHAH